MHYPSSVRTTGKKVTAVYLAETTLLSHRSRSGLPGIRTLSGFFIFLSLPMVDTCCLELSISLFLQYSMDPCLLDNYLCLEDRRWRFSRDSFFIRHLHSARFDEFSNLAASERRHVTRPVLLIKMMSHTSRTYLITGHYDEQY
jgi:hypothetical protein